MIDVTGERPLGGTGTLVDETRREIQRFGVFIEARSHQTAANSQRSLTHTVG